MPENEVKITRDEGLAHAIAIAGLLEGREDLSVLVSADVDSFEGGRWAPDKAVAILQAYEGPLTVKVTDSQEGRIIGLPGFGQFGVASIEVLADVDSDGDEDFPYMHVLLFASDKLLAIMPQREYGRLIKRVLSENAPDNA